MKYKIAPALSVVLLAAVGCQSQPPQPPAAPPYSGQGVAVPGDQVLPVDVSGQRIEAINEDLLIYVKLNAQMPPSLEALRSVGPDLNLGNAAGKEFGYLPAGVSIPATPKVLIVYDPDEGANGRRWCILVSNLQTNAPLVAEVDDLPESTFRAYAAGANK